MSARNKDKARISSRDQASVQIAWIGAFTRVAIAIVKVGGFVWIAYYVALSLIAMTGKQTHADIVISLLGKLGFSKGLAWALGLGGVTFGLARGRLSDKEKTRLGRRVKALELKTDSRRSSSNLDDKGHTPEDQ